MVRVSIFMLKLRVNTHMRIGESLNQIPLCHPSATSNNLEQGQVPIYTGISRVYSNICPKLQTHKRKGHFRVVCEAEYTAFRGMKIPIETPFEHPFWGPLSGLSDGPPFISHNHLIYKLKNTLQKVVNCPQNMVK
jgi:hypothetical protein